MTPNVKAQSSSPSGKSDQNLAAQDPPSAVETTGGAGLTAAPCSPFIEGSAKNDRDIFCELPTGKLVNLSNLVVIGTLLQLGHVDKYHGGANEHAAQIGNMVMPLTPEEHEHLKTQVLS